MGKDQELLEAARNGNIPVVEKILSQRAKRSGPLASLRRGPGANVQDSSGYSALHHAALNGHKEVVQLLLAHEASTNILDVKGSSPLHLAAWTGNVEIVRLLLNQGPSVPNVNLTTKDNETALHCAAQYGHTAVVSQLLEHACDPTIRNSREESALDLAAQYGRLETVELLVRTHPELLQPYTGTSGLVFSHTPLHLASRNGHKSVVMVLLAAGMDVNVRTGAGSALHEAALCGKTDVVRALLAAGIDLTARDQHGRTVQEVLAQFPPHVTHDISAIIDRHRQETNDSVVPSLPPIPVPEPSLGSPYDNVRGSRRPDSSPATSPTHWEFYHKSRDDSEERRVSAMSVASDSGVYPRGSGGGVMDSSFHSEDLSLYQRDADQISISSTASSSAGAPATRERGRSDPTHNVYMPMHARSHATKVSPTPPKKPPRRNLSVSPTHLQPMMMSVSADASNTYEYLFMARSGGGSREQMLRRGRSADQYVDMMTLQPVAITAVYDNVPIRTQNPRRKLRRHNYNDRAYENYEPISFRTSDAQSSSSQPVVASKEGHPHVTLAANNNNSHKQTDSTPDNNTGTFVSNAYITLKSSQESLLETPGVQMPLSPTHYQQPPTPDHPPPSALQAEKSIHERIRPLSQEYKRRSRDIETETEEDLLMFPSLDASSGSLSSSVSLSDKSVSTDNNVEEFLGDAPFAGLLKGSTTQNSDGSSRPSAVERPKTLRRLKNVYENSPSSNGKTAAEDADTASRMPSSADGKASSLSILSPFDEQEEWAKISEIMASYGTGIVRESVFVTELEKEFQNRLGLQHSGSNSPIAATPVGQWLAGLGLAEYESIFISNGYDDVDFINGVLEDAELRTLGVGSERDRAAIVEAAKTLPCRVRECVPGSSVDGWLAALRLECYQDTFRKHLYCDMERVQRVWEVELTAVLEISKSGHRKRILASVSARPGPNIDDINADLNTLKNNIQQLKDEIRGGNPTGTLRHSHKKARPAPPPPPAPSGDLEIREPSELLVGVPATLTTQWRHRPQALLASAVTYLASYLGSTVVKELRGTESTKKSIQKLKKSTGDNKALTPDIILSISYRGVKFLQAETQALVCEHEIRNIHCACQDADDLTHFAYITKDHASKSHYCHVFCVSTMDQATEVILTLGQAFEVAYQMALREQFCSPPRNNNNNNNNNNGHTRSQSAVQMPMSATSPPSHSRSLSVNEIKVNGQLKPLMTKEDDRADDLLSQAPIIVTEEV